MSSDRRPRPNAEPGGQGSAAARGSRALKRRLREWLGAGDAQAIAALASSRKRVLGTLVSLTYDREPLVAWRAVEAMGMAADRVAESDPAFVRSHLRRLHWLLSEESGGFCPHAAPAMAEIIRLRPHAFPEFAPIVTTLLDTLAEEDLIFHRNGVLWAIGRLAPVAPDEVASALPRVQSGLDDPDPQVRGMAVWCLVQAGKRDVVADRAALLADDGPVELFADGGLHRTTVGALAAG